MTKSLGNGNIGFLVMKCIIVAILFVSIIWKWGYGPIAALLMLTPFTFNIFAAALIDFSGGRRLRNLIRMKPL